MFFNISLSISRQTHEFIIYVIINNHIRFSCVCPVNDNEFCHNIVNIVCKTIALTIASTIALWIHSYFDNVIMKFMIKKGQMHLKLTSIC